MGETQAGQVDNAVHGPQLPRLERRNQMGTASQGHAPRRAFGKQVERLHKCLWFVVFSKNRHAGYVVSGESSTDSLATGFQPPRLCARWWFRCKIQVLQ